MIFIDYNIYNDKWKNLVEDSCGPVQSVQRTWENLEKFFETKHILVERPTSSPYDIVKFIFKNEEDKVEFMLRYL